MSPTEAAAGVNKRQLSSSSSSTRNIANSDSNNHKAQNGDLPHHANNPATFTSIHAHSSANPGSGGPAQKPLHGAVSVPLGGVASTSFTRATVQPEKPEPVWP